MSGEWYDDEDFVGALRELEARGVIEVDWETGTARLTPPEEDTEEA